MERTILIIGRDFHPDGKETAKLIATSLHPYLAKHGYDTTFLKLKDVLFDVSTGDVKVLDTNGRELKEYGAVLMTNWFSHASIRKDIAYSLALYFERTNTPFFNEEALKSRSTSKLSQLIVAAYNDVPIARTIFSLALDRAREYAQGHLQTPFILKDAQASRGKGNYLLDSFAGIDEHASAHTERSPFVLQQFIQSDGSDFRFFLAGDQRVIIKRSGNDGSHLNNTSAGGAAELVAVDQFSDETLKYVDTMSRELQRTVTGIDIMFDRVTGMPYFLEANPIPQIATGSFTDQKLDALSTMLAQAAGGKR